MARTPRTVLIVSGAPILGGAERSLLLLATHLPEQGWTPVIACPDGGLAAEAERRGVRVVRTSLRSETTLGARGGGSTGYSALALVRFGLDTARRRLAPRPDRPSRAGGPRALELAADASAGRGRGTADPTPGHAAPARDRPPRTRAVECSTSRRVERASWWRSAGPRARPSSTVGWSWSSIPVEPPPAERPAPAWDLPRPVVGFLGRLDPPKGIEDLLRAAADLPAQIVVVGEPWAGDEAYVESLRQLGEEQAPGRVHFTGALPDPWTALAGMDVLAVPSRMEPFGRVAAEGQLAGVPVVAADAGGLPDAITDGVDGLLFPVGDVAALTEAVLRVLDEPALRDALVSGGARVRTALPAEPARRANRGALSGLGQSVVGPSLSVKPLWRKDAPHHGATPFSRTDDSHNAGSAVTVTEEGAGPDGGIVGGAPGGSTRRAAPTVVVRGRTNMTVRRGWLRSAMPGRLRLGTAILVTAAMAVVPIALGASVLPAQAYATSWQSGVSTGQCGQAPVTAFGKWRGSAVERTSGYVGGSTFAQLAALYGLTTCLHHAGVPVTLSVPMLPRQAGHDRQRREGQVQRLLDQVRQDRGRRTATRTPPCASAGR